MRQAKVARNNFNSLSSHSVNFLRFTQLHEQQLRKNRQVVALLSITGKLKDLSADWKRWTSNDLGDLRDSIGSLAKSAGVHMNGKATVHNLISFLIPVVYRQWRLSLIWRCNKCDSIGRISTSHTPETVFIGSDDGSIASTIDSLVILDIFDSQLILIGKHANVLS